MNKANDEDISLHLVMILIYGITIMLAICTYLASMCRLIRPERWFGFSLKALVILSPIVIAVALYFLVTAAYNILKMAMTFGQNIGVKHAT